MATAKLIIVVEVNDEQAIRASYADDFIRQLEEAVSDTITQVQENMNFFPDEEKDEGIYVVSELTDETEMMEKED